MSSKLSLLFIVPALALASCATQNGDLAQSAAPNYGEAHRYNMAIQTIDPDPVYDDAGAQPGDNGERAAAAVKRYRQGETKDVEVISVSGGSGGPQ